MSRHYRRGQTTVEFAGLLSVVFMFITVGLWVSLSLVQNWSLREAVDYVGQEIVTDGYFDPNEYLAVAASHGLYPDPDHDTLLVTVNDLDGVVAQYNWNADGFLVSPGQMVTIEASLDVPADLSWLPIPAPRVGWSGIVQPGLL